MSFEITPVSATTPTTPAGYRQAEPRSSNGSAFAATLGSALAEVQQLQSTSNDLSLKAVTGELADIHTATLASARASLALETAATFRNRGVEAFNEIMRMQA